MFTIKFSTREFSKKLRRESEQLTLVRNVKDDFLYVEKSVLDVPF